MTRGRERWQKRGVRQKKQQGKFSAEERWYAEVEGEEERKLWEGMGMKGHDYRINSKYYLVCEDRWNFLIASLNLFPVLCTNLSPNFPCFELPIAGESRGSSLLGIIGGPIIV